MLRKAEKSVCLKNLAEDVEAGSKLRQPHGHGLGLFSRDPRDPGQVRHQPLYPLFVCWIMWRSRQKLDACTNSSEGTHQLLRIYVFSFSDTILEVLQLGWVFIESYLERYLEHYMFARSRRQSL